MISGGELNNYCSWAEKIGRNIGNRSLSPEQAEDIKKAYESGLEKGIKLYEETCKIMSERDLDDFINS